MLIDQPWMTPLIFIGLFVALWLAVSYGISFHISWPALARCYRASMPFEGLRVPVRHAQFARRNLGGGVNNGINLGVNASGIEIRMVFLFRLNCPTLFVPWTDIRV